jgi:hypothetical protein
MTKAIAPAAIQIQPKHLHRSFSANTQDIRVAVR